MGVGRHSRLVRLLRRALAAGSAAVILALGVFAASPISHEQLHHDGSSGLDDGCAIVLFANGVAVPVAVTAPPPPATNRQELRPASSTEIFLQAPPYLLQPERGPPRA